ncbi:dienelactone hydrolase family protein [Chlamydiales bacterium]|nr:dienelactone hydrolase family protein [Chlamydiales bacterium]
MKIEASEYQCGDLGLKGDFIFPEGDQAHPCIIIFHAWKGKDSFVQKKGKEIVSTLGIGAFCADLYGGGESVESDEEAGALMMPLFKNREELQKRVLAAFEHVVQHKLVNRNKVGAIGFCFGGLAGLELFRSGVDVKGVCLFHPVLGNTLGDEVAETVPIAKGIENPLLVMVGNLDPLVNQEDITYFKEEMTNAGVDWQLNIYGRAYHAFTNPAVNDPSSGLVFNHEINRRAFQSMGNFFTALI